MVEALIGAALLTLVAARRLRTLHRQRAVPEFRGRDTQLRFATESLRRAVHILACLLKHLGFERAERSNRRRMSLYIAVEALDPHVLRQRFREVWSGEMAAIS